MFIQCIKTTTLLLATFIFLSGCSSFTYRTEEHGEITIRPAKPDCVIVNSSDKCMSKNQLNISDKL